MGGFVWGLFSVGRTAPWSALLWVCSGSSDLAEVWTWIPHLQAWAASVAVDPVLEPADVVLAHFVWLSSTVGDNLSRLRGRPLRHLRARPRR